MKEVRCYYKADYNAICEQLKAVQWQSLMEGKDVKHEWIIIKASILHKNK